MTPESKTTAEWLKNATPTTRATYWEENAALWRAEHDAVAADLSAAREREAEMKKRIDCQSANELDSCGGGENACLSCCNVERTMAREDVAALKKENDALKRGPAARALSEERRARESAEAQRDALREAVEKERARRMALKDAVHEAITDWEPDRGMGELRAAIDAIIAADNAALAPSTEKAQ